MIFANTFPHCSYSCMHSHCDSKYGNKSGVKMEEEIYPLQKLCVYIYAYEKKTGVFPPTKKIPTLEREELALSCMVPGSPLCPAHPPCCRTGFEGGVHIKKSIATKSTFEVFWQKNKGMDHPARPWAPTGTRAFTAFLVLQEVTAPNFLKHLQPQIPKSCHQNGAAE